MQVLKVLATLVQEISRVDKKPVQVIDAYNIGQGLQVNVYLNEYVKGKHYARFEGSINSSV